MANNYDVDLDYAGTSDTTLDDRGFISTTANRAYTIALDIVEAGDNEESVRRACQERGLLPREGDVHPSTFSLRCVGVNVRQESPLYYKANARYSAAPRPQDEPEDPNRAPWDQPTAFKYGSHKELVDIDEDVNGDAIVNAGTNEPVVGVQRRVTDLKITATKNLLGFNPNQIPELNDAVNNATFLGYERGRVIVEDISAEESDHDGTKYYKLTVVLLVRKPYNVPPEETWWNRRIVKGFYAVAVNTVGLVTIPRVIRAVDEEKNPVTTPVNLDAGTGFQLSASDPPQFTTDQTVFFADLSQLGL